MAPGSSLLAFTQGWAGDPGGEMGFTEFGFFFFFN